MNYPSNFPTENEQSLVQILQLIQQNNTIITNKNSFEKAIKKILTNGEIKLSKNQFPSLWHFQFVLNRHSNKFPPKFIRNLKSILIKNKLRSASGIIPVSVFTKGVGCPFQCIYCANEPNMPKSYFSDEPALMRAIRSNFDPFQQVFGRLQMFYLSGHPLDKIDLIIQGGTFSFFDNEYRTWFVKRCFDAANTSVAKFMQNGELKPNTSPTLNAAHTTNENSKQKIIGLTIETRPDFINKEEIKFLRNLGVTRIELGAQTTNNRILKHINRGHSTKEIISATYLLKEAGFKITYHLMPGLPKSTYNKDITMLTNIFTKEEYKPDNIKFYPTSVVKFSPLQKIFQDGQYKPYSEKTLTKLILEFKKNIVPPWVRIQRLVRDLTTNDIVHNTFPSNLRQKLEKELKAQNIICPCIRCREIKYQTPHKALKLNTIKYNAASGTEYFLEYLDSNNNLYGLLRLRIPQFLINKKAPPLPELKNAALVRELHIYGQVAPIGQATTTKKAQHQGLGQKLLKQAQIIAKKHNAQNIAVISGIGARGYYQKLGYTLKGTYMVKNLTNTKN